MRKSSAYKVQYDLRPAKQTERRILLDILKLGIDAGLKINDYQYLGFGGFKFYDFEMLFRHLGIRDMVSVEYDETIYPRCVYNKPFNFIKTFRKSLGEYLSQTNFEKPVIAWLDYDCNIKRDVIADLIEIGGKAPVGSYIFATIDARLPETWIGDSSAKRIATLKYELEDFALGPTKADVQPANFHHYAEKVIWAAMILALSKRTDATFIPLARLFYKDTAPMITVGGVLCPSDCSAAFLKRFRSEFPFLGGEKPFEIPPFNFTLRERNVLDAIVTSGESEREKRSAMRKIGLTKEVVNEYKRMIRYVPKYFESYL